MEANELRSAALYRRTLNRLVLPAFGKLPISSIRRSQIANLRDDIKKENGEVMAKLTFAIVRRVFSWHQGREDHFVSPLAGMSPKKATDGPRSRVLDDDELRAVWLTAEASTGLFGALVRFLLLTAARRDEAAEMSWSEIKNGIWTIPAARHKTGRRSGDLERPLSAASMAVLDALPRIGPDKYVFTLDGERPFGGISANKDRFDKACGVSGWTIHDLRRTARSLMSRAGIPAEIAEQCLGHKIPGIQAVYDRHRYLDEKGAAFEKLAALIERIVHPTDNVVPLETARK